MIPKLLIDILKCTIFCNLTANSDSKSSCEKIVNSQKTQDTFEKIGFQLPEPWTGDIVNAPILVMSSNPGYAGFELYPNFNWPDSMMADFFMNRFKDRGSKYSWVYKNKVLNNDGTRGISVRYWTSIQKRVEELILRPAKPGIDYCITEIVHCKSPKQIGVDSALHTCSNLFLNSKLRISQAKLIIGVGSFIRDFFKGEKDVNGIPIVYLPHPNSRVSKTFSKTHSKEEIEIIREILLNRDKIGKDIDYSDMLLPTEEEVKIFIEKQINLNLDIG